MNISNRFKRVRKKYGILLVLILLFIIATLLNSNFLSARNLSNISKQVSITTILAFGETILIISGMLDLSNGSVLALAGLLSVSVFKMTGSLLLAFLVAIIVAVICNILNGIMVTKFKTPPFIATLAMMAMARGAALLYTNGQNIYQIGDYTIFGQGSILGIPTPIIFLVIIAFVTWYILHHTRLGRSLYAIGGNEEAAVASGVNVNKNKMKAYIINGVFVGIAGVIFMSRVNAGLPNGGQGFEFQALTASIIGGTSFSGGIGTAGGTVIGAFIVGTLNNIMNLTAVNSYLQQIIRGAIIALAVIYDTYSKNMKMKSEKGEIEVEEDEKEE
ncbi:monosaccharide ABC transporter membrane protein (CUT2 family) [Halanaerobium saccharolyticum]|uniref:Monosaccharide ABC transporter membrane protein (CUT2 family) n=1 Tax=Halanaerobium saccharolyticum TaxID=43595 RepID=A0A4R6LAK7_9FIRM|nr:ABC transporter permease [Halanaerobium saccharolyticum]TDO70519.1 monosaccharide ABC transporter membrane protein (CUT2 family) [Halanaerobium saccharolyticum]